MLNLFLLLAYSSLDSLSNVDDFGGVVDFMFNGAHWQSYFLSTILAYFGYVLSYFWIVQKRENNNDFDWSYFWRRNYFIVIRDFLTLPFIILFYPQLIDIVLIFSDVIATKIGFDISDEYINVFKKYNTLTVFTSFVVGFCYRPFIRWNNKRIAKKRAKKESQSV